MNVAPAPGAVSRRTAAVVGLHDGGDDGEAEAGAARPAGARLVGAEEGLEHLGGHIRFEPGTVVGDGEVARPSPVVSVTRICASSGVWRSGVAQEVGDDLAELVVVAQHVHGRRRARARCRAPAQRRARR